MDKFLIKILVLMVAIFYPKFVNADALIGEVTKEDYALKRPQVVDADSKRPIKDANVLIPSENKIDRTDENGYFKIKPSGQNPVILSIQKDGYRPFSMTLQDGKLVGGVSLELEKKSPLDVVVSSELLHLGDDSFSANSAGACQIFSPCVGPSFTKSFYVGNITPKSKVYVYIGSVIGIDTVQAMRLKQNNLTSAFSSPVEIFVNKTKIGELKINGDNQKIQIPNKLLKSVSNNMLTVKTGTNRTSRDGVDYDDIQLMNLIVNVKN